jgi:thymidylate kinase
MCPDNLTSPAVATRPFLVTFSGIDGAGKTTQIEELSSSLQRAGLSVVRLSFWDNVAVWSNLRAGVGGRTEESQDTGLGNGNTFVPKNNKHVRRWYLTAARSGLYVLDVAKLRRMLDSDPIRNADVVIFDRYVYDQIANIDSQSVAARAYGKLVLSQTPVPDLAFVIDASPDAAFARKPEYPLEFVRRNRENFLRLREVAPELIVISEGKPEDVSNEILLHVGRSRLTARLAARNAGTSPDENSVPTPDPVVPEQSSCSG